MPVYRVNANQTLRDQSIMNVYYYETDDELDTDQMEEVGDEFVAAYQDSTLDDSLADDWSLDSLTFRRVDVPNLPELTIISPAMPLTGNNAGQIMATQIAVLVSGLALTAFPRRVRTYLGGFTEGGLDDGLWTPGVVGDSAVFIGQIDSIAVTGDTLERVSVELGDTGSGVHVVDFNRVDAYSVTEVPATQRRRRIGVGE